MSKVCTECKQTKSTTEFNKCKTNKDGLQYNCKQCVSNYHLSNKLRINQYHKKHYIDNVDDHKQRMMQWKEKNNKYWKDYLKKYHLNNKISNPHLYKWRDLLWDSVKRLGKSKESSTHNLLKYSALDLKEHLDKQNMNWETDHIDHKIPITWFESTTPVDIVNDLRNLQPLNELENKSKKNFYSDKVDNDYYDIAIKYIKEEFKNKVLPLKD